MATSSTTKKNNAKQKNTWKRKRGEELDLPSGNVALVKRPGMEAFLTEGLIPDSLMPIVNAAINTGKGLPPEKLDEMTKDPQKIAEMMDSMDRVVVRVVVEPKVLWHKEYKDGKAVEIPDADRDDDMIYTDDVDFEDKSFIFQYAVGGTRDLERFRNETRPGVDAVQDGDGVQQQAE